MKNRREKFAAFRKNLAVFVLGAGVLFLAAVYGVQTKLVQRNVKDTIDQTLAFMKTQCIRYDNFQAADMAKSLFQLVDKTKELSRCLGRYDRINEESLQQYAKQQRLDGIIIFNQKRKPVCEYSSSGGGYAAWKEVIQNENIQDIYEYPQKTYTARMFNNKSEYDYAAVCRKDEPGIIFAYMSVFQETADKNQIAVENLLTDYKMDQNGIILITDDEIILSSNDMSLQGGEVSSFAFLENDEMSQSGEKLVRVRFNGESYYGGQERMERYYLYAFYPLSQVYAQRATAMLYALLVYILFCLVILIMRHKSTQKYMDELNRRYDTELEYQKKLEQAIREAERANMAKTDFLRRMSHDIRTPINGIRGMIEIGNHFPQDMQKQAECRGKILEASGFLLDLVNDVLDMNKLESGQVQLEERPFNLSGVLREVAAIVEVQAKESGITFHELKESGTHWDLIGSPLHLRQLFMNVLSNAVKYNKENGSVSVSCSEVSADSETAVFEFVCEDTGIGMGKEFQRRMFEPFAQENGSVRTSYAGTGLGLSIVKALVEKMNGTIEFSSELGKGTVFTIKMPFRIDPNPPVQQKEEEAAGGGPAIKDVRILLVEDNELNMEIAEFMLANEEAVVTKAWNGKEAVELFSQSEPGTYEVILMDLMMPVMDGLTAARAIRSLDREDAGSVVIIAMTANSFADDVRHCIEAGMNEHVAKPLDFDQLVAAVTRHLKSSRPCG